jgi:hypothetical protein
MVRKISLFVLMGALLGVGVSASAAGTDKGSQQQEQKTKLVTEGEFARWLVNVLGLTRTIPADPSEQDCFAILLQNSISPKAGWNSTNLVTMGTLARVVVQSLHKQGEVTNPAEDASWINYLKSIGIDFGTIGQAMAALGPIDPAYAGEAAVTTTDPLKKQAKIRPLDEQQFGADLQSLRSLPAPLAPPTTQPVIQPVIEQVFQQAPPAARRPRRMTPS